MLARHCFLFVFFGCGFGFSGHGVLLYVFFSCPNELFFFLSSVVRLQGSCNVVVVAKSLIKAGCFFGSGGTLLLVRFLESGISYEAGRLTFVAAGLVRLVLVFRQRKKNVFGGGFFERFC